MTGQACVVCGTAARPGRHACGDCGGAVVPVTPSPSPSPSPAHRTSASPEAAATAGRRAGSRRPFVIAAFMLTLTVGVAATIGIVTWRDYRDQPLTAPSDRRIRSTSCSTSHCTPASPARTAP